MNIHRLVQKKICLTAGRAMRLRTVGDRRRVPISNPSACALLRPRRRPLAVDCRRSERMRGSSPFERLHGSTSGGGSNTELVNAHERDGRSTDAKVSDVTCAREITSTGKRVHSVCSTLWRSRSDRQLRSRRNCEWKSSGLLENFPESNQRESWTERTSVN